MTATPPAPPTSEPVAPELLKWRAVGGVVWLISGTGLLALIKLPVVAILARLLSPAEFGVVAAAGTVIWLSSILADLGVGAALVQRRQLEPIHVRTAITSAALLGVVLALGIYLSAPLIAAFFRIAQLADVMRVLALVFPIVSVAAAAEHLLQRRLRFRAIAAVEVGAYAVGYGVVGIALAIVGWGVWSLVGAEMTKSVVRTIALLTLSPDDKRPAFRLEAFRDLMRFGAGYTMAIIFMYLALSGDNVVVGRMLGAAALGVYSRAYDIMVIPTNALGRVLVRVLFPSLSRLQHDVAQLRTAYRRALALVALLVMPVSAVTIVLAPEIVATLLGPKWSAAVLPLRVLAAAMYLQVSHKVAEGVANAMGAVYRTAWRSALYAFLVIAGAVLGQRWGLVGVATGVVVAIAVNFGMLTHLSATLTHLSRGELARVHLPGFVWSASVAAAAALVATMLRDAGSAPVVTLVLSAGVPLIAALIALRLLSLRLLGADGVWLVRTLGDHAPAPLRPVLGVLLGARRRG